MCEVPYETGYREVSYYWLNKFLQSRKRKLEQGRGFQRHYVNVESYLKQVIVKLNILGSTSTCSPEREKFGQGRGFLRQYVKSRLKQVTETGLD